MRVGEVSASKVCGGAHGSLLPALPLFQKSPYAYEVFRLFCGRYFAISIRGGSRILIGEGLQVIGGAFSAIEGAPLPLTVTMHYNENYEMLVSL